MSSSIPIVLLVCCVLFLWNDIEWWHFHFVLTDWVVIYDEFATPVWEHIHGTSCPSSVHCIFLMNISDQMIAHIVSDRHRLLSGHPFEALCRWCFIGMWGVLTLFHCAIDDIFISPVLWIVMTVMSAHCELLMCFLSLNVMQVIQNSWSDGLLCGGCLDAQVCCRWELLIRWSFSPNPLIVVWTLFPFLLS